MHKKIATLIVVTALTGLAGQSSALARSGAGYGHMGGQSHVARESGRIGGYGRGGMSYGQSLNDNYGTRGYPHRYDDCFRPVRNHEIPGWPWDEVYTCNYNGH